ncbi:hypothetical protein HOU24_gp48 [Corynebacterium phage SamW]|uniref:Uncharacterized protein n=4 Tax=Samwavirus TaxID=2733208 RepID=A0A385UHU6_9CAUD|nr:hypothetical protein HOU24_gp48 [Corynebacterium phage SamW]YP_009848806.1 hypothetical protein HWC43_gp50 [Corynebacterium phage Dina]YP_009849027.1 hypothetical protein HWC46_gp48 [Corynebacterium phage Lederberg]AYQ98825.1 hypothetical protein TROY_48 [Corynebacterium phage Troy]AYB70530.1 hypothetical protein SAMW_48 [Corynebacterium phage SamW]QDF19696.1 hypothetical protein SEA_DINA_50 [Corynebacterium phage Dina]QDF20095.1 hypothetical protein SEA_LEDERBERG_48 [Corynebacterium phage
MNNHVSVTGTIQHGFRWVWEVHDDRLPIDPKAGRFSDWADAVAFAHKLARMGHIAADRPSVVARIYYTNPDGQEVREATLDVPDPDGDLATQLNGITNRYGPPWWPSQGHQVYLDGATLLSDRKVTGKRTQWHFPDDHQPFGGGRPVAAETTVTAVIDRPSMEHRNG